MGERRAAPEMHKRDEMVGKEGGRDAERERVGVIVLYSRYRI